ncbi:CBS domain-containing protein [Nocardioides convexus]|uniref:CBS domain-containing protein n=1 Tax=Nocardioides convexus TaxID=2712224 RepID=UPI003101AB77
MPARWSTRSCWSSSRCSCGPVPARRWPPRPSYASLSRVVARDLARPSITVPADLPLAEALRRAEESGARGIVTATTDGRPVGVVEADAVRSVPQERLPWMPVSAVARSLADGRVLPVSIQGDDLLGVLRRTPASEYVLVGEDGSVHGVLATADIIATMRSR